MQLKKRRGRAFTGTAAMRICRHARNYITPRNQPPGCYTWRPYANKGGTRMDLSTASSLHYNILKSNIGNIRNKFYFSPINL